MLKFLFLIFGRFCPTIHCNVSFFLFFLLVFLFFFTRSMGNNSHVVGIFELRSAMPYILTANKSNALTVNEWNIDTASDKRPFLS